MARIEKIKLITPDLKNRCQREDAPFIRELLDTLYENGLVNYKKVREDHRYHQGYLQALDDILGIVVNP